MGRAGRFGTKGLAISFVTSDADKEVLKEVQSRFVVQVPELPDEIDASTYSMFLLFLFILSLSFISFAVLTVVLVGA